MQYSVTHKNIQNRENKQNIH